MRNLLQSFKRPLNTVVQPATIQKTSGAGPAFMSDKVSEWRNELRKVNPYESGFKDAIQDRPEAYGQLLIKQEFENQLDHVMDKVREHQDLMQAHIAQLNQPEAMSTRDIERMFHVLERFLATCEQQKILAQENKGWLAEQFALYKMGYQQSLNDLAA
jgi:predicted XRE-type DNA-binding protein